MRIIGVAAHAVMTVSVLLTIGVPTSATEALRRDAEIIGVASVIDGDTLEIHDRRIRLDGIDAPESAQLCLRDGRKERCGQRSAFFLADLIGQGTVRCVPHDVDRAGHRDLLARRVEPQRADGRGWPGGGLPEVFEAVRRGRG